MHEASPLEVSGNPSISMTIVKYEHNFQRLKGCHGRFHRPDDSSL